MGAPLPPLKEGQEIGSLRVKDPKYDSKYRVLVECFCGKEFRVRHQRFRSGLTRCCLSCQRRGQQADRRMSVSAGEIYEPWEVLEDAAGSKTRVKVRCTGCRKKTTRRLYGIVEMKHSCLACINISRGVRVVIYRGRTIPISELIEMSGTLTIIASEIHATPRKKFKGESLDIISNRKSHEIAQ